MTVATTTITRHTLIGGGDNPNCFSLLLSGSGFSREDVVAGRVRDVRVVNMRMGPFERVAREYLRDGQVEVSMLNERCGLIVDARVPRHELEERWCRVCCPFCLLPEVQQREMLKRETPTIQDGKLIGWTGWVGGFGHENTPEQVEEFLRALREIGEAS